MLDKIVSCIMVWLLYKISSYNNNNNNNNSSFICLVIRCTEQGHNKLTSSVFKSLFHYPYNSLATIYNCMIHYIIVLSLVFLIVMVEKFCQITEWRFFKSDCSAEGIQKLRFLPSCTNIWVGFEPFFKFLVLL